MSLEESNPFGTRAAALRKAAPQLVATVRLYETAEGGRATAAPPGWGCPCLASMKAPLAGYDAAPLLKEPLAPGEIRHEVGFVFLTAEGAEAMREAGHFYLWEGRPVGEAFVTSHLS